MALPWESWSRLASFLRTPGVQSRNETLVNPRQFAETRWRRDVRQRAARDVGKMVAARPGEPHFAGLPRVAGQSARRQDGVVRDGHRRLLRAEAARTLWRAGGAARVAGFVACGRLRARRHRRGGAEPPAFRSRRRLAGAVGGGQGARTAVPERHLRGRRSSTGSARCNPHPRDRASFIPELPGLLQASGRLEIVEGEYSHALGDACVSATATGTRRD